MTRLKQYSKSFVSIYKESVSVGRALGAAPRQKVCPLLLGKKGRPVGLHLLQPLCQVAIGHLHLLDLVQCCP